MKMILDLSHYNTVVDWNAVKSAVDGVILRVAYRGYSNGKIVMDKKFKEYAKACKSLGIPFGIYFMSQAITVAEAIEEALYTIQNAQVYGATLPSFIDSEWSNKNHNGRADYLSKSARTEITKTFCNKISEYGFVAGVYASESWFNDHLIYNEVAQYYVWVADYGKNTGYKVSSIALRKYDMHQYTSQAYVNGISGRVDMSEMYTIIGIDTPDQVVQTPVVTEENYNMKTIKRGSKGNAVKVWQIIVGTTPDGDFGKNTDKATLEFQKKAFPNNPKEWDSIVGKNSWKAGLESL